MALVLSLKSGDDVFIGGQCFSVGKIDTENDFSLIGPGGKIHRITDAESEEVMAEVYISAGSNPPIGTVRVAIEAPKDVLILRGERGRPAGAY
ncbi:MAG: carbon storage regulator [Aquamicrobium sp.]|uniref:hypothetical protein n=1 Tax=Aquamicrobium sp. TaxID=1872579 RepID=UPI00349E7890|nr:carbon storage regulator [Aquamicrobium sp.]